MDSYNDILKRMKDKYKELTSYDVPELSDIDIRMRVLAGEIYNDEVNLEFLKRQMFPNTASGEYLNYHAETRGISRKPALKAKGTVRFYVEDTSPDAVVIPANTIVSTGGENPVRFTTDSEVILEAGYHFVSANCTAQTAGARGNVGAEKIDTIITNIVGVDSVKNLYAFTGGSDTESDDALRERIIATYKNVSNGTNIAYYKKLALSVDGVYSACVVPRARGAGTVDINIVCENGTAPVSLVNRVETLIQEKREVNVDIDVSAAQVTRIDVGVYAELKSGYTLEEVRNNITSEINSFMKTLEVGDGIVEHRLSSVILNAEGLENFEFNYLYPSSYNPDPDVYLMLGDVIVEESEDE